MDDPLVAGYAAESCVARVVPMSRKKELTQGIFCLGDCIAFRWDGREERFSTTGYRLKGVHNLDNIMAALAATLLLGCDAARAQAAVACVSRLCRIAWSWLRW
jgi:UDP-N-acetylmuramoylalanine--D-glutamate ligase